jgi:hypothetical protein
MARMMMKDIKRELLLALLKEYQEFEESDDPENPAINVVGTAKHARIDVSRRDLKLCIEEFSKEGLVTEDDVSDWSDGEYYCYLTARGIEAAEALKASTTHSSTTFGFAPDSAPFGSGTFADTSFAPASDRYVSAKDNQPLFDNIRSKVAELSDAVRENRDNDFDDKEGRLAELAALDLLLSRPQISIPLVEKILSETVTYLAKRFADVAIGQVALEILKLTASALWTRL